MERKYRGAIKITYEQLARLLNIENGYILNIMVKSEDETISIIRNDKYLAIPTAENEHIQTTYCYAKQITILVPYYDSKEDN